MSARDVDYAEQLFGRVRGVLDRNGWGTKAERTNTAWAILDEILTTPTDPPRLAFARALAAAGHVIEQDWQPIETAPKDGTRFLCFAPAAEDRASLVRSDFWWVRERAFAHMRPGQPYTHWRPLPTAPAAAKETQA